MSKTLTKKRDGINSVGFVIPTPTTSDKQDETLKHCVGGGDVDCGEGW